MKNAKSLFSILLGVLFVLILVVGACAKPAPAVPTTSPTTAPQTTPPKPIELKYACSQPANHQMSLKDLEWAKRIEEQTGGRVKITSFFGGTVINPTQGIIELEKGVAELSDFSSAYMKEGFEIDKAVHAFFYGIFSPKTGQFDWEMARRIYNEARAKFPQIDAEWKAIKVLARQDISSYHLFTFKPVRKMDDFKGMIIKASGTNINIMTALGAEGVPMPMPDVYLALQKGTITGAVAPYETGKSFNFFEVAKYVTALNMGSSPSPHRGMNLKTWNSLPPDIQKVFEDNIEWWGLELSKTMTEADAAGIENGKRLGAEFIRLSPADEAKFYQTCEKVVLTEMAKLDAKGIPASEIFKYIRSLIVQYSK